MGSPESVGYTFSCDENELTSLIGAPNSVHGHLFCLNNPLVSLEGFPKHLEGCFMCLWNKDLPLLRALQAKEGVRIYKPNDQQRCHPVNKIINKYRGHTNLRHAILDCRRDLIAAGYEGNAKW